MTKPNLRLIEFEIAADAVDPRNPADIDPVLDLRGDRIGSEGLIEEIAGEPAQDDRYLGLEDLLPFGLSRSWTLSPSEAVAIAQRFGDAVVGTIEYGLSHIGVNFRDGATEFGFTNDDHDRLGERDMALATRAGAPRYLGIPDESAQEISVTEAAIKSFDAARVPLCNNFRAIKEWAEMCLGTSTRVQQEAIDAIAAAWVRVDPKTARTYSNRLEQAGLGRAFEAIGLEFPSI